MNIHQKRIVQATELVAQRQHIVAFTGAGISTASGIPDYRSPNSGLWENADPMTVASIFGFRQNPQAFYNWVRPLTETILNARPNAAHVALAQLETAGKLQAIITQNIDMLHDRAGNKTVFALHGHMREATCIQCFAIVPGQPIIHKFIADGKVPYCEECGGVLKPNVILYGEQLPARVFQAAEKAARHSDLFIVISSSLETGPANQLPYLAHRTGAAIIVVNREPTPADDIAEVVIQANAEEVLPAIIRHIGAAS